MKLFLFGGAEIDVPSRSVALLKSLIKETLIGLHPKYILHIPFARLHPTEKEWSEGWFRELMGDTNIEILDARIDADVSKVKDAVVFINGGIERRELINTVNNNKVLYDIIVNAQYIVAESAGSMVMGEYLRADRDGDEIIKGFRVLPKTIIEPHYTEKYRQELLIDDMKKSGMQYGIGIDSATGIIIDPMEFPEKWSKIGVGNVEIKML